MTLALASMGLLVGARAEAGLLGVDVSKWQGYVNWNAMESSGVDFAFARATRGNDYDDEYFVRNMNGARAAGIPIGPYHYSQPATSMNAYSDPVKQDAINEANDFVDAIQPFYEQYPGSYLRPVLDVEELPTSAEVDTVSEQKTYLSAWVKDFNSVVQERLGLDVIIYCNSNYARNYLTSDLSSFDLWIARWTYTTSSRPTAANLGIWDSWDFWQFSDSETIGGESPVDGDYFDGTVDDLQAFIVGAGPLEGDYNNDGFVDAADYTMWRDSYLAFGDWPADGNGNSVVEQGDYDLWSANYGEAAPPSATAVPEPVCVLLLAVGLASLASPHRQVSGHHR
ncbi:glycoside hydrolase family 25 protein [Botrimarina colliarenosi]|uniref:glycoside hydrolase family 25 protein n=1 Tax=Botrimarina colliarenosi TaxID=2528001 RepID=UPI0018D27AE3|nr:glycoside hydrolase family 25 protein [Botrimarina colliarenosi]